MFQRQARGRVRRVERLLRLSAERAKFERFWQIILAMRDLNLPVHAAL